MASNETVTFDIRVKMQVRWVPYFLGMLRIMQNLGNLGGSRIIAFFSDGDGDFRPKFDWAIPTEPEIPEPVEYHDVKATYFFDAG